MVWHQGIHDKMSMQRMGGEGVEGAPGLVPWRGKGRSGTGVFAWCLSESVTSHAPPPWHQHTPHAEPSDETEEREGGGGEVVETANVSCPGPRCRSHRSYR